MHLLTLPQLLTPAAVIDGQPVAVGPGHENDNLAHSQSDGVVSIAIVRFGGEWVVSAFKVGADGEPDTDNGEIFVKTFQHETKARWLYRSCVAMIKTGT